MFEAKRNSPTSVSLKWKKIQEALGYNIRYGIAPDKLYNSWQLYDETEYRLNGLNAGIHYYFCVDTYNESGITFGDIQYLE